MFISLFGSALHNCRWMRPGAIVIEIRGTMRNDFADYNLYADVCAETMGLRWAGLTTEGHAPPLTSDPATGRAVWGKRVRRDEYSVAKIDAAALVSTLELALRGNFTALVHEYARNVTWKAQASMRGWAEAKLALPQYKHPCKRSSARSVTDGALLNFPKD